MDIQQGNVVTSKMMLQLRPGMTKSQVRFIMGTPLIQDSFHSNRWDYFYQMRKEGKVVEQRRVILEFENEALKRVKGDVIPAGTGDGSTEETTGTSPVSKPEAEKKGIIDKLQFWKGDEKKTPEPQSAPSELVTPAAKEAPAKEPATKEPAAKEAPAAPPVAEPKAPEPAPAAESKPEPEPVKPEPTPEPAKAEEPAPVAVPEPAKPEPAPEPAPQKQMEAPTPAAEPEAVPVVEPEAKPVEKAPEKPADKAKEKPAEKPEAKPEEKAKSTRELKPAPTPEKEPEEGEPGYFEYMLQKIGF